MHGLAPNTVLPPKPLVVSLKTVTNPSRPDGTVVFWARAPDRKAAAMWRRIVMMNGRK